MNIKELSNNYIKNGFISGIKIISKKDVIKHRKHLEDAEKIVGNLHYKPKVHTILKTAYELSTNKKWSQFQESGYSFLFWTIDGYTLQRIVFFKPVEDGRSLFDHDSLFTQENDKSYPKIFLG